MAVWSGEAAGVFGRWGRLCLKNYMDEAEALSSVHPGRYNHNQWQEVSSCLVDESARLGFMAIGMVQHE